MGNRLRHEERIREKIALRLDNRQIAWLIMGCAVISAAVFGVGYTIGSNTTSSSANGQTAMVLPAILQAPEVRQKQIPPTEDSILEPGYTYDSTLSKPTPRVEVDDPTLQLLANKLAEIEQEAELAVKAEPMDMALAGPRPAHAVDKNMPVATKPTPHSEGTSNGVQNDAPHSSAQANSADPGYTIQVKAFRSQKEAAKFLTALKSAGHSPYMLTTEIPGKGMFYRVRLGKFRTLADASQHQSDFENLEGFKTIVTPL